MILNPRTEEAYKLLHNGVLALARAEQQGFRVDMEYVERKKLHLQRKMDKLEADFKDTKFFRHWEHSSKSKVNINSGIQLGNFLYGIKKITPKKFTDTGKGSVDEEALEELNIPELNLLLQRSKIKKTWDVLNGFAAEQVDGYVHPVFNLHLVKTFRSSSDTPNFQNIPKRDEVMMAICRKALYPRPGHQLLEIDFSQLEVRIAACYNKDQKLIYDILHGDMHSDMAKQIWKMDTFDKKNPDHALLRQSAKNGFVFPEFYGDYYKNCAVNMAVRWCKLPQSKWSPGQGVSYEDVMLSDHMISKGILSYNAFERHIRDIEKDFWGKRYPDYDAWKDRWWNIYRKHGYIDMLTGFRCSGVMDKKNCINYPVQGAAFHCLLWSFIELDKVILQEGLDSRLIGQIHDSMIIDVNPKELDYIIKTARRITCELLPQTWKWIIVPLDIDMDVCSVDASWMEKVR